MRGDGARVILFFPRVIQQLGFWTQKIQANVDYYCYVGRRAECTLLGPGLKHPSLRSDSTLAAKSRAEAFHVVFFSTKHPSLLVLRLYLVLLLYQAVFAQLDFYFIEDRCHFSI